MQFEDLFHDRFGAGSIERAPRVVAGLVTDSSELWLVVSRDAIDDVGDLASWLMTADDSSRDHDAPRVCRGVEGGVVRLGPPDPRRDVIMRAAVGVVRGDE